MNNSKNKDFKVELGFKAIEVLNSSIQSPTKPITEKVDFTFDIKLEYRVDAENKHIFIIVHVKIKDNQQSIVLGSITTSCIYEIVNFQDVIIVYDNGKVDMPTGLMETLNATSISTTRGVMFSTFKGTFLHSAILPIVDMSSLKKDE